MKIMLKSASGWSKSKEHYCKSFINNYRYKHKKSAVQKGEKERNKELIKECMSIRNIFSSMVKKMDKQRDKITELKAQVDKYWDGQKKVQDIDVEILHTKNRSLESQLIYSEKWKWALEAALAKSLKNNKKEERNIKEISHEIRDKSVHSHPTSPKTSDLTLMPKDMKGSTFSKNKKLKDMLPIELELFKYQREESLPKNYEKISSFKERATFEKAIRDNPVEMPNI